MVNDDIAENVLRNGKDGIKQNMIQVLEEFVACYADEMWQAVSEVIKLREENATLHERLEKAVELPAKVMIERTLVNGKFKPTQKAQAFNGRIGVVYRDETRWKGLLVDICSERTGDYEAAEARLIELKGEKK